MLDVFTLHSSALPKGTRVVGFRGSEGLSRLYAFEIHLTLSPDASNDFDLPSAVGASASLVLDRQDGRPPFAFHGVFAEHALVHHDPDGRALVRAVLVPRLWRLTQTCQSRVFTKLSIPDVLKKILEDGGFTGDDYTLQLSRSYPPEEHVCQYRESSLDFISRWMEREGLFYWFEHGDAAEKLVITDGKPAREDRPAPIRMAPPGMGEGLQSFVCRHRALPACVRLKGYDYTNPMLDVSGRAQVSKSGHGEIRVYGQHFLTPDAGRRLAQTRAEEMLAREQVFTGSGTAFHLHAGSTFSIEDHPRSAFDQRYLVTDVEHHGNQAATTPELKRMTGLMEDDLYRAEVTAVPHAVQFRAEQRTPWPRIYGTEHGVIDGETDSEYAQLDDQGRYLVRFVFDESDLGGGKASSRVRMMQPYGGDVEGWHFPLRKGTEVLITFLGGDPDRPVITGMVPNALTPSPVTSANPTRNVIQTSGRNRLELEDKAGVQRITLSTPHASSLIQIGSPEGTPQKDHEVIVRTDGSTLLDTGKDWDVRVLGDKDEEVKGSVIQNYKATQVTNVEKGRTETVWSGGMTQAIVGGFTQKVTGDVAQTITGSHTRRVTRDSRHWISGDAELTVNGDAWVTVTGSVHENFGPTTAVYQSLHWSIPGGATITTPKWHMASPHRSSTAQSSTDVSGHSLVVTGIDMEAVALKVEAMGVHTEVTGIHLEHQAVHGATKAVEISKSLAGLKDGLLNLVTFGLHSLK